MRVAALWRYPVKSMMGERLEAVDVEADGIPGDRSWAVWLPGRTRPLSAKREPLLFEASARLDGDSAVIELPSGFSGSVDDPSVDNALAAWLGYEASLRPAQGGHAFDDAPIHVLTTGSLRAMALVHPDGLWDERRFRPNVLVDTDDVDFVEDGWTDGRLELGEVSLTVVKGCTRCTMVGLAQGDLSDDLGILESVMAAHDEVLGVYATVNAPGSLRVGDTLRVV